MPAKSSSFQTILLIVFGALFLAGVMVFALATAGNKTSSIGNVTIWGPFDQASVDAVLRQAADANGQLLGVHYVQRDAVTYESDLSEALANGTGPDLFFMPQDQAVHNGGKAIHIPSANLTPTQFSNLFIDAASPFYATDGVVALPFFADPLVLYWNHDLLSAAGVANPPQYWDEIPALAQKLTQLDDAHTVQRAAIAMGEYRNINAAKDILTLLMLQAGNPIMAIDPQSGKLTVAFGAQGSDKKSGVVDALSFYTRFADPSDPSYSWSRAFPESRDAFTQGKLALYIGHASDRFLISAANPNLNFSIAPVMQLRSATTPINIARVYGLARARTSKNPDGALTAAYLLAAGNISAPLASALGLSPALRSALTTNNGQGVSDLVNKAALISHSWNDPDPVQTGAIFQTMVESVISGGVEAGTAIKQASDSFGSITI